MLSILVQRQLISVPKLRRRHLHFSNRWNGVFWLSVWNVCSEWICNLHKLFYRHLCCECQFIRMQFLHWLVILERDMRYGLLCSHRGL